MLVMILERVPRSLRGELSCWMIEPKSGVFIGNASALVRERLWEKATKQTRSGGGILQIWTTNNEQGFAMRTHGDTSRELVDMEGLILVRVPQKA